MGYINLANKITITRIIIIPFFIASIVYGRNEIALIFFIIAVISDGLDGLIARTLNQKTALGTIIDPIADKLLLMSAYISLAFMPDAPNHLKLPPYVPIVVISRDIFIVIGSIIVYFLKGDLKVSPSIIGKVTTFFQMMTVVGILVEFKYSYVLWTITVVFTVSSGLDYLMKGARLLGEHASLKETE
ncbi:MAG: CDP-alcohol phosphatidyltransferase family protein [Candidatus Omnitrophica bacterium]|nr:CDP-alcohol phosphatidyltransferase family protein [Candidatus Omnitrophota bacterium]